MSHAGMTGRHRRKVVACVALAMLASAAPRAFASGASSEQEPARSGSKGAPPATPLSVLVAEATTSNPDVRAARDAAKAATYAAPQVSSLPDPHVTLQQLNVGSPRPFAGYTNSDFAYLGVSVSQELPFPGKRALRGDVAHRDADVVQAAVDVVLRDQIEALTAAYARLAYLQQASFVLNRQGSLLEQIEQQAEARYTAGLGVQSEVLRAQLERTKLLRDVSMNRQATNEAEADLKRLVRRPQDSPDVVAEPLTEAVLPYMTAELLAKVRDQNPDVAEQTAAVTRNQAAVALAQKEFRPDFSVGAAYQSTGPAFRDYYMFTFDVSVPRRAPRNAALAEARANVDRAQDQRDAKEQDVLAEVQRQFVIAKTAEEQWVLYRDGLLPQSHSSVDAGLAAYRSNRQSFDALLASSLDVLNLDLAYQQTLLDHAVALAHIERLTGVKLP
jgi:outer membrane protein TolC